MQFQDEKSIQCPYCWEKISILVDPSIAEQEYVEDCHVCCRPILLNIRCENQEIEIQIRQENP